MDERQRSGLINVLVILCVIILGLIVCIIIVNLNNQNLHMSFDELEDLVISGEADSDLLNQYIDEINDKIEKTDNSQEKAVLYSERAGYISIYASKWNDDKLKVDVLTDAYKAEELNPTADTAYDVYFYEREFGDEEKSNQYYNLSVERGMKYEGKG